MNQMIRVIGERETEARRQLEKEGLDLTRKASRTYGTSMKLYSGLFFAPLSDKNHLGHFTIPSCHIILSEELLLHPFATVRNVFIHELAHALDYAIHGHSTGHGPEFREYCSFLGIEEGFEKAKLREGLREREKSEERVRKLLALSTSPFENEALQALSKAQKLLSEMALQEEPKKGKNEKIYEVDLYESGRTPLHITRLLTFVQKATGVCVVKCQGDDGSHVARAYGELAEVEAALYLFQSLVSAVEAEVKKLRKAGRSVTKDSFVIGAVPEMEKKLQAYDATATTALTVIQNQNLRKAKRLVFQDSSLRTTRSRGHITSPESFEAGRRFGQDLDLERKPGIKKISG